MTTSVLKRTDATLVKFVSENPWQVADQLSEGHIVEVQVVAILFGGIEEFEAILQQKHVANGWYNASLKEIAMAWATLSENAPGASLRSVLENSLESEIAISQESETMKSQDSDHEIEQELHPCFSMFVRW